MVCFNCLFCVKKTFSASIVEQRKWKQKRYPFTASSFRFRFHKNLPLPPLPLPASASTSLVSSQCSKCDVGLFLGCKLSFHKSISYTKAKNIAMIIFQKTYEQLYILHYFASMYCNVRNTILYVTQYCVVCFAKGLNKCKQKTKLL